MSRNNDSLKAESAEEALRTLKIQLTVHLESIDFQATRRDENEKNFLRDYRRHASRPHGSRGGSFGVQPPLFRNERR